MTSIINFIVSDCHRCMWRGCFWVLDELLWYYKTRFCFSGLLDKAHSVELWNVVPYWSHELSLKQTLESVKWEILPWAVSGTHLQTQEAEARGSWLQAYPGLRSKTAPEEIRGEKSAVLHYIVYRNFRTMHTFLLCGIVKRTLDDFMSCIFTFIA